jgi:hypothetical protein
MNYSTGERNEDMTSTTHAAAVSHLVSAHGTRAESYRTSNFIGYVDMNTVHREIIGSLRTRANGWSSEACETCEDMDVEKPAR